MNMASLHLFALANGWLNKYIEHWFVSQYLGGNIICNILYQRYGGRYICFVARVTSWDSGVLFICHILCCIYVAGLVEAGCFGYLRDCGTIIAGFRYVVCYVCDYNYIGLSMLCNSDGDTRPARVRYDSLLMPAYLYVTFLV